MTEPIRGKVARLLNSREIVINVGSIDGVAVGMRFDVVGRADIRDPDTNEPLGSVDRPKVSVRITEVKERLSVASTYRETQGPVGGPRLGPFSRSLMPLMWETNYETLKTEEGTWEEEEGTVKVGDPVVQIIKENEVEQKSASSQKKPA